MIATTEDQREGWGGRGGGEGRGSERERYERMD